MRDSLSNTSPEMARVGPSSNSLNVPGVSRPLHLDTSGFELDNLVASPSSKYLDHSPGLNTKIKVAKRHYSMEDPLERMATPMFDKEEQKQQKKGPSSAATVLAMSGLFVVGVILMASGILVLILQSQTPFVITGCLFLGFGFAMLLVCAILQRKNVIKYVLDMNRDLYFLNMSKTYMWKMMFEMRSELPLASD